jgi:hypothetical protein
VSCKPNSLIYREDTGKYLNFGHNLRSAKSKTAAAAETFFGNSLEFVAGNYFEEQGNFQRHQGINWRDQGKAAKARQTPSSDDRNQ